jgi:hypothetical protein
MAALSGAKSEQWAASQRIRFDLERDAFSRLLDAPGAPRSEAAPARESTSAAACAHATPIDTSQRGVRSTGAETTAQSHAANSATQQPSAARSLRSTVQERDSETATLLLPLRPMTGDGADTQAAATADGRGRPAHEAHREAKAFWIAVDGDQAHLALRVKGDAEQVRRKLDLLLDELGLQPTTLKINGIVQQADAGQQEKNHGG